MTQRRLGGGDLHAVPTEDEYGERLKCGHSDSTGDRCRRWSVVVVTFPSHGEVPACRVHAKDAWLHAAGIDPNGE